MAEGRSLVANWNATTLPLGAQGSSPEQINADMKICDDEGTFPILTKILDHIRRVDSYLGAQEEWFEEVFPPAPVLFRYERKTPCSSDVLRASKARDALRYASNVVKQLSDCISRQAVVAEEHVKVFHLRRGMSSMPDELLAPILQDAATTGSHSRFLTDHHFNDSAMRTTVLRATKLSHTCQRFRRLLVDNPKLWNRLSNNMPPEMLTTCYDRLVAADAEIHLTGRSGLFSTLPMSAFIRTAMDRSDLWHSYDHHCSWKPIDEEIKDLAEATACLSAPSLSTLSVAYAFERALRAMDEDEDRGGLYTACNYFSTWSMPKLTSFKTYNIVPVPFKNPVALKFLDITYVPSKENHLNFFRAFTRFLSSCEVLEDLRLYMLGGHTSSLLPFQPDRRVKLNHVTRANVSFHNCRLSFLQSLLNTFVLPNVTSLTISLRSDWEREGQRDCPDGLIDITLFSMFQVASAFPRLVELELDFAILRDTPIQVALPFSSIQTLKRLTLISERSILAPIPDGPILPSLDSLVMKRCFELDEEWIASFLDRLVNHGRLKPSQLKVKNCVMVKLPQMNTAGVHVTAEEMLQLIK